MKVKSRQSGDIHKNLLESSEFYCGGTVGFSIVGQKVLLIVPIVTLSVAYITYGKFLAKRWAVDPTRRTTAVVRKTRM